MMNATDKTLPRWLYTATDAHGRETQGFVSAATAQDALANLARTRPDLGQVQLRSSAFSVGTETELVASLGAGRSPAQLTRLARDLVQQQTRPGWATTLQLLVRRNALWLLGCGVVLAWGFARDWPAGPLVAAGMALALPFAAFLWLNRFTQAYEQGLRAHAVGDVAVLNARCQSLTRAAHRYRYLRAGAWDLAVKCAWHQCRSDGQAAAQRTLAAHPFPAQDDKAQVLVAYSLPLARGDLQAAAQALRQALDRWPDEPTLKADLALMLARAGHTEQARRLIGEVPPALLPPAGVAYRAWIEALAVLSAPDKAAAIQLLTQAGEHFLTLGRQSPAAWPALAVCTSDLALALAWSGRVEEARTTVQPVLTMVKAHLEPERLALLRRALNPEA